MQIPAAVYQRKGFIFMVYKNQFCSAASRFILIPIIITGNATQ